MGESCIVHYYMRQTASPNLRCPLVWTYPNDARTLGRGAAAERESVGEHICKHLCVCARV